MSARVRVVALVARDEWSSELSRELAARDLPCARVGARRPCEDAIATLRPDAVVISRAVLDADGDGALAAVVARARTCGARVLLLASWKLLVAAVAPPEVDRLLLEPIAAADVAAVIARELAAAAPPPRATAAAAALAGTSLLGRERSPALHDLVGRLVEAFGARQGGGFFHDRDWIELGADPPSEHRRFIRQVVFAAAAGGAPLIAARPAEAAAPGTDTYLAAFLTDGEGRRIAAIWLREPTDRGFELADARLLRELARRFGAELSGTPAAASAGPPTQRTLTGDEAGLEPSVLKLTDLLLRASHRAGDPVTLSLIEITGLDAIVARHGRTVGDDLRRHVVTEVAAALRAEDVVAPLSSGLIMAVLPGASAITAGGALQRVRDWLTAKPYPLAGGEPIAIATSIGAAAVGARGDDGAGTFAAARKALGEARAAGRSPRIIYPEEKAGELPTLDPFEPLLDATFAEHYRLLHPISSGAVGVVYRAEDLGLSRPVAVKLLRHELARNPEWVMRFRQEAAILASLRHPNIVQAYACGEHDGTYYLVMELVEGSSVKDLIDRSARERRPIAPETVASVVSQIASALDALHAAGIVHRDVKPANILMDPFRDRAVLVDVGIAQRRGTDRRAAGTLGYMAPEVLARGHHDARSDVFGLAVTAFELLTGRQPWTPTHSPVELLTRLVSEAPLRPSELAPAWAPLDEVLAAGLATDPEQRIGRAGELASRLAAALAAIAAAPAPTTATTSRLSGPIPVAVAPPTVTGSAPVGAPRTRAAVVRQLASVTTSRELATVRDRAAAAHDELSAALSASSSPLGWLPTASLLDALRWLRPDAAERAELAQALGRAVIRTTFRRLFPASGATLAPSGTLSALPAIWAQYHSWGAVATSSIGNDQSFVTVTATLREPVLCALATGMLEQLILLSGGGSAVVRHDACEARGDGACEFEAAWELKPYERASTKR